MYNTLCAVTVLLISLCINDCIFMFIVRVCRDQWIRAKYDRKEFVLEAKDDDKQYLLGKIDCPHIIY